MIRIKPNWSWQRAATTMNQQPVSFSDWKEAIAREPLSAALRSAYIREIITFLKHCKTAHAPATVELLKQYGRRTGQLIYQAPGCRRVWPENIPARERVWSGSGCSPRAKPASIQRVASAGDTT